MLWLHLNMVGMGFDTVEATAKSTWDTISLSLSKINL